MFLYIKIPRLHEQREIPLFDTSNEDYFELSNKNQSIEIRLKKRDAYPTTYYQKASSVHKLGYGKGLDVEDEYLHIEVRAGGVLSLRRDAYCTLPIYYAHTDQGLVVSNVYSEVIASLTSATLSKEGIQYYFTRSHYQDSTFLNEVRILRERETLIYKGNTISILQPPPRSWLGSVNAPPQDPKNFPNTFRGYLQYFYHTRLHNQRFACEVSGGLDSATLPLFLGTSGMQNFSIYSLIYTGTFTASQQQKLTAIAKHIEAPLLEHHIHEATDFPFSSMLSGAPYPFFARDPFTECIDRQMKDLYSRGVKVVATGHGGDEIFENALYENEVGYGEVEQEERRQHLRPLFMTPLFDDEYITSTPLSPQKPMPLHSPSFLMTQSTYKNKYIEHDIWPVTPFASPFLYAFCQGLPVHFRANKNIMRMYHAAFKFPELIYNPIQNENFSGPFKKAVQAGTYEPLMKRLQANSLSIKLGYVDEEKLSHLYETIKYNQEHALGLDEDISVELQMWMGLELSLQATKNLKS